MCYNVICLGTTARNLCHRLVSGARAAPGLISLLYAHKLILSISDSRCIRRRPYERLVTRGAQKSKTRVLRRRDEAWKDTPAPVCPIILVVSCSDGFHRSRDRFFLLLSEATGERCELLNYALFLGEAWQNTPTRFFFFMNVLV